MCIDTAEPEAPPPPPAPPPTLEQDAPKRAKRTPSQIKRKAKGTKAYRTNTAAIGGINRTPASGGASIPTIKRS